MIDEGVKLEPLKPSPTKYAEEFKSQVIPSIQTALLNPSDLEVTDQFSWMMICTKIYATNCVEIELSGKRNHENCRTL